MRIASWNVNSIKSRLGHVKNWLAEKQPDVLMLQELKGMEFPEMEFAAFGYKSAFVPQKAYNGVATLSKHAIEIHHTRLPGDDSDEQARYLETTINGLHLINIYLPNGNPVDSEKYHYKLAWMDRLRARLAALRAENISFAIGGDFNVIPEDRDCYDPVGWQEDALFRIETRQKFRALLNLGLTDALRVNDNAPARYTFWDYQAGSWPANKGLRIDHFLLSPALADKLQSCVVDTAPRGLDSPSDHTPIIIELAA
ncbi:MAG TPA: exodeoxyribonuclease III [Alphaproteobacteria bacterium]|jgi:exodeoxyribonuclease-3